VVKEFKYIYKVKKKKDLFGLFRKERDDGNETGL
jgi:hypothetical protein